MHKYISSIILVAMILHGSIVFSQEKDQNPLGPAVQLLLSGKSCLVEPVPIKDICPGACSSSPGTPINNMKNMVIRDDGTLFFTASSRGGTPPFDEELWKSDGTTEITMKVKDIGAGPESSNPRELTLVNDVLYFTALDVNGENKELWRSDGFKFGTEMIDIRSAFPSYAHHLIRVNDELFFYAFDNSGLGLWKIDKLGNPSRVHLIRACPNGQECKDYIFPDLFKPAYSNGKVFFSGWTASTGRELWAYNLSTGKTGLVREMVVGGKGGDIKNLIGVGGRLYFTADTEDFGRELCTSDGSKEGTYIVKDIFTDEGDSIIRSMTAVSDTLYFLATHSIGEHELWRSEGTNVTTRKVFEDMGQPPTAFYNLTSYNGKLYFTAANEQGTQLWKTDGSKKGTSIVKDIAAGSVLHFSENYAVVGDMLFFSARAFSGYWVAHLMEDTKGSIKTVNHAGFTAAFPYHFTGIDSKVVYFGAFGTNLGYELWKMTCH